MEQAPAIGFGRYIISATTPFTPADLQQLRTDAPAVVRRYSPGYEAEYRRRGWSMVPTIDRVYVNELARAQLGWQPRYDFNSVVGSLQRGEDFLSPLARAVGSKGYHAEGLPRGRTRSESASDPGIMESFALSYELTGHPNFSASHSFCRADTRLMRGLSTAALTCNNK